MHFKSGGIWHEDISEASHPQSDVEQTTAYRAISISSHMVGIPGHCETECDFKMRNDEIQYFLR